LRAPHKSLRRRDLPLYFLGHDIGLETDTGPRTDAPGCDVSLRRPGTAIDLAGTLELTGGEPTRFAVKGRNYRLFTSDAR
jgi:hypothetical protein